jgi:predicted esterase
VEVVHLEARVHGRVLAVQRGAGRLLVGFHGYGESAAAHLAELEQIPGTDGWDLAAVQALHPFYTRSGEVVASWMTSIDRELAIDDNIHYVQRVVGRFPSRSRLVFAGFSQGAAMAYRAAAAIECDGLIVLGGDCPPDVDRSRLPEMLIGRGRQDQWFTEEKLKKDLNSLANATVELFEFEGAHEWSSDFRQRAGEFLARRAG